MDMRNCAKWTWNGVSYEVCDFGTFLVAHLPPAAPSEANSIQIGKDTTWSFRELGCAWGDEEVLTIRNRESCGIALAVPSSVARVLERWLMRTATREETRNPHR
jgi:hypothetical protein